MNLTLVDGVEHRSVRLWQTPTYITWMCLSYAPDTRQPDGGMEGVRRRYLLWVQSQLEGAWDSREDYQHMKERVTDHVAEIRAIADPHFGFI